MNLKKYYQSLSKEEKKAYAKRVDFSFDYIRVHLIPSHGRPDSTPPLPKLEALASESKGNVTFSEVVEHFKGATKRAA